MLKALVRFPNFFLFPHLSASSAERSEYLALFFLSNAKLALLLTSFFSFCWCGCGPLLLPRFARSSLVAQSLSSIKEQLAAQRDTQYRKAVLAFKW